MRLLIVSSLVSAPWGGSEELWARTALALRAQGVDVMVVRPAWMFNHPKIAALRAAGVRFAPLADSRPSGWPARLRRIASRRPPPTAAEVTLRACTRTFTPDLVLISEAGQFDARAWFAPCATLGLRCATLTQVALDHVWPTGAALAELQAGFPTLARCYFVSAANLALTRAQLGLPLPQAHVVWNPFNVPFDQPFSWPDSAEPLRLACVARLTVGSKGQDLLLRALAAPVWRNRPWHLALFGEGPHESLLRTLAAPLGADRVTFHGHIADLTAVWREHHALVLPSRYEGLPLAALEAMLCHRPVIATDAGGNAELIDDGRTGFLAAGSTVRALSAALERTWAHRADLPALGRAAGHRIRQLLPRDPGAELATHLLAALRGSGPSPDHPDH